MSGVVLGLEAALERTWPHVSWRVPLPVATLWGDSGLGCRYCIALFGLRGSDIRRLPQTEGEFATHMAQVHPFAATSLQAPS